MIRKIIKIDSEKCNGCGLCVDACHEGAIGMENGKAVLLRDDYCDGLGDCLPVCPTGAISFEEREALPFDEEAVKAKAVSAALPCGCPGTYSRSFEKKPETTCECDIPATSYLNQWPVQMRLVPPSASYFNGAKLLIAADCTAYAYAGFHSKFMKNKVTLIGCPKLDHTDYADKLTAILKMNDIKSITVVRMEVPCCGGIVNAVAEALKNSKKVIPWQVVTITADGQMIEN